MQAHGKPRSVEWLALALVVGATLVASFALAGSLSAGTSLAVLALLSGTFVLAIGAVFGPTED